MVIATVHLLVCRLNSVTITSFKNLWKSDILPAHNKQCLLRTSSCYDMDKSLKVCLCYVKDKMFVAYKPVSQLLVSRQDSIHSDRWKVVVSIDMIIKSCVAFVEKRRKQITRQHESVAGLQERCQRRAQRPFQVISQSINAQRWNWDRTDLLWHRSP